MDKYPASPPKGLTYDELCEGVTYWADRIEGLTNWAVYHKNYNDETNNAQTDEAAAACDAWYKAATDAHDQEARHAAAVVMPQQESLAYRAGYGALVLASLVGTLGVFSWLAVR